MIVILVQIYSSLPRLVIVVVVESMLAFDAYRHIES